MKYIVQYGAMRALGVFTHAELILHQGNQVIVKTHRGQEAGMVRCEANQENIQKLDKEFVQGQIIRLMTEADEIECQQLQKLEQGKLEGCQKIVQDLGIAMKLVRVEHTFGGERIIIYYTAEGRIDFRELVKVLVGEYQLRVEMRQINAREEMKVLHVIGDCGREVCCGCFLRETPGISIKMAKLQKVTLEPAKISGHCGRLKCCLRYEYDCYVDKKAEDKVSENKQSGFCDS